jgi:hypothetical protein
MDFTPSSTLLVPAGIAVLVGWRMYARIRRMVGRQRLSKVRPWLTVVLFPLLAALLLLGSIAHPLGALALVAGGAVGVALGQWGLHLTRFEVTPLGLFYTPNAPLGIALSLLLVVRIAYRLVRVYLASGAFGDAQTTFGRSPLTLLIFGMLAGYYVAYAIGLLRWRARVAGAGGATSASASPDPGDERSAS